MNSRLLLRADATPTMGTGHVMRCLALALTARGQGLEAVLAGHFEVPWVRDRLAREGIPIISLPGPLPRPENPADLLEVIREVGPKVVALDGYHFGLDCHQAVMEAGCRLLVIDDYGHLPEYRADFLLNQNLGAERIQYQGRIGEKLLGPSFALLRPEFVAARSLAENRVFPERARNLMLTLGGGNCSDHLRRLAPDLAIPELAGSTLWVIAGQMPPPLAAEILKDVPARVEVLTNVTDMPGLMLQTDLAVTAGGSTCWELCCLGVPFLTVKVAENQQLIIEELTQLNIAFHVSAKNLAELMRKPSLRTTRSKMASSLVNGRGCARILPCLL